MADINRMDRTWLCSVLFMDIAVYSSQSVELQMKWKQRFNTYLAEAIQEVPESERVILDTGDGAAVCFLGAPEAAMFAALQLCRCFTLDEREQPPGLRVRMGINLGPVKLVKDINGALNALGDGINAGQRIMSFAAENQILVSQSFFEVVSRLSDDYKKMFQLKGVETDKSVRLHTVYHLTPPGLEMRQPTVAKADGQPIAATPRVTANPEAGAPRERWIPWLVAGIALAAVAALGLWHFYGSSAPAVGTVSAPPESKYQTGTSPRPIAAAPSPDAKAAYDGGMRLLDEGKAAEAARRFDDAIRVQPDFVDAYVGRAEARRRLLQYELSLEDCNAIIHLNAEDARGYNCRGFGRQLLQQYDAALPDFDEAIRRNPRFILAYEHRGTTYNFLQQYERAVADYSEAIRLSPRNGLFYVRRGVAYGSLKQYDKAIQDYTQSIRLQPDNVNAYRLRAVAEEASGDATGAAEDRRHSKEIKQKK